MNPSGPAQVAAAAAPLMLVERVQAWFDGLQAVRVACSGGIDSLLLSHLAHRALGTRARIVHAVSPAVPTEATQRLQDEGRRLGWAVEFVEGGEFADESYLANPVDRCYHCKSHLYSALELMGNVAGADTRCGIVSGANLDDLGEYRPGLKAAKVFGVRHPYIKCGIGKADIRAMARALSLTYSELPASPCLASRLYTGTRVTPARLRFVHRAENLVRARTGCAVVRCRIEERAMRVELEAGELWRVTDALLDELRAAAAAEVPDEVDTVALDERGYASGRAFVGARP